MCIRDRVSGENSEVLNAAELYEYDYSDYYTTGAANVTLDVYKRQRKGKVPCCCAADV